MGYLKLRKNTISVYMEIDDRRNRPAILNNKILIAVAMGVWLSFGLYIFLCGGLSDNKYPVWNIVNLIAFVGIALFTSVMCLKEKSYSYALWAFIVALAGSGLVWYYSDSV